MTPDVTDLLAFAEELADAADRLTMAHFGGPVAVVAKPDGSPVTEADRGVEAALRARIAATYPDHAILGEEEGGALDPATPTWVLDPIDGTANFLRGVPVFATLIALVHDGRVLIGMASAPAMGERWDAAAGRGARRNGQPVGVSAVDALRDAHVLHGGLDWFRRSPALWNLLGRLADASWRTRGFGDFWMHLLVAGGMADVALERDLKVWDVAALECIVTEAGGRLTAWDGGSALADATGAVLSTNGLLHPVVEDLLAVATGSA
ncbi:MAG TPA: inositol monophosphatase family protein [Egibacteraceae bacterium]|nr:inositol monophosphatase family protein [Egibacteraceae bacterium]